MKKPRSASYASPPPETGTVVASTGDSETRYTPETDAIIDEGDLVVYGETPQEGPSESGVVPVRLLRNLVIYEDTPTKRLIPLEELRSAPLSNICISGLVSSYVDHASTDDTDTEDDGAPTQMVILRNSTDFIVHWVKESPRFNLDP